MGTTGSHSSHLNKHGSPNSPPMLNVWKETSTEATNDVDSMMKNKCHMVDHLMTERDVKLMLTDTTVKIQLSVSNNWPLVSPSGLTDISHNALVKETTNTKSTEWPNGTVSFKLTSNLTEKHNFSTFIL